jgi:toxin ParE1/3/4
MKAPYSLIISDEAYFDILDAYLWYNAVQDGLGNEFERYLEKELLRLIVNPELFQIKYQNIRVCYLEKFPYGIHYLIDQNFVKVLAVFHTLRNPRNWQNRL